MKISEHWLREWVDPGLDTGELAEQLSNAGLEVDSVTPVADQLRDVVVAEVLEVSPHPQADKLSVCRVKAGVGNAFEVVCGAPNVHSGMLAPLALPGAMLGETRIRRSRIRGVESNGMLCSARELGLGDDADGIVELDAGAPVGESLVRVLGLDDHCLDIELTPNRGDCLSIAGIAREVAVLNRMDAVGPALAEVPPALEESFPVHLEAPADCARYVGRIIRDIDPHARTPMWMRERLRRCGVRPISPVVDVTNYVMLELGQPMHAFDLDTLEGAIRVRRARDGETLTLLDDREITLTGASLVIADDARAVALAGVMGGLATSVTAKTRNILLESAYFTPRTISVEARRLGLHTDASHRFERSVSPRGQRIAAERATALLLDIVGGRPGTVVDALSEDELPVPPRIRLRASRIVRLLGVEIPDTDVVDVLSRLGMSLDAGRDGWRVTPPDHRADIAIEADLIEEVARITGYDRLPAHAPTAPLIMPAKPEGRIGRERVRDLLVHRGYQEAVTYSFVDATTDSRLNPDQPALRLANPISADMSVMRTSLWPGLLQALLHNVHRQRDRVRLFELGLRFLGEGERLEQQAVVGGIAAGPVHPEQWGLPSAPADFYDVKADVQALLALPGRDDAAFLAGDHPALHPGQSARIELDGRPVGHLGALHPRVAALYKLDLPVFLFELELAAVQAGHVPGFEALSRQPAVRRDIAVIFDESVSAQAVRDCVGQVGIDVLENLELFDVYRGEGIDSGKKSLALGLTFQASSRTLTDAEIDRSVERIVGSLNQQLGGTLRG